MQKVQKTYTAEFKREAVRLDQTSGKPIAQAARELGISDTSIHQWRKELAEHSPWPKSMDNVTLKCWLSASSGR